MRPEPDHLTKLRNFADSTILSEIVLGTQFNPDLYDDPSRVLRNARNRLASVRALAAELLGAFRHVAVAPRYIITRPGEAAPPAPPLPTRWVSKPLAEEEPQETIRRAFAAAWDGTTDEFDATCRDALWAAKDACDRLGRRLNEKDLEVTGCTNRRAIRASLARAQRGPEEREVLS